MPGVLPLALLIKLVNGPVNGVEARGGSIDAASITAANGYLFVNSGYGMFGQLAGNVLLAFRVKGN